MASHMSSGGQKIQISRRPCIRVLAPGLSKATSVVFPVAGFQRRSVGDTGGVKEPSSSVDSGEKKLLSLRIHGKLPFTGVAKKDDPRPLALKRVQGSIWGKTGSHTAANHAVYLAGEWVPLKG